MKRMVGLRLALAALPILLGGCAGQHVLFHPQVTQPDEAGRTNLFLDARGHLYPADGISPDYARLEEHDGSLFEAAYDRGSGLCAEAPAASEMALLCDSVSSGCSDWSSCLDRWELAQQELWRRRGQALAAALPDGDRSTLVMLLHGFNNRFDESRPRYAEAEQALTAAAPPGRSMHFVRVFWDGCRGSDTGVGCWGRAQATGPLVGFSLRLLMNGMDHALDQGRARPAVRILTHSSGAFVAGALVGNPVAALPLLQKPSRNRRYEIFAQHASARSGPYRVPRIDRVRIAMLAAATPYTTFSGTPRWPGGLQVGGARLLISVHPRDRAITKLGILGCRNFGASCLGARTEDVCQLKASLGGDGRGAIVDGYDFRRDPGTWGEDAKAHDFAVYSRQAAENTTFFRDFLSGDEQDQHSPRPVLTCP